MDFARILADAVARSCAPTPFADALAAFEQGVARAALEAEEPPMWARVLHVSLPCCEQDVRAAFRRRAFDTHPDRPGGSHAAFLRIQGALEEGLAALRAASRPSSRPTWAPPARTARGKTA